MLASTAASGATAEDLDQPVSNGLTSREREVLELFADGKSAQDVAQILNIALTTVMFRYRRVAERYGTLNRAHTLVEAIRRGELEINPPARALPAPRSTST